METVWSYMKKRIAHTTRYMSPSNRAAMIELMLQTRNDTMISNTALQLYMMARWTLVALHFSKLDVNKLTAIVSQWPDNQVSENRLEMIRAIHVFLTRRFY